jgi:TRAP-type mannitol/chloroaromatic compound transport system permease small subunit
MINVFEFLYYSLYRVFKLVKRVGEKDENLAASFFSILLSTNTGMILFVLRYIVPKDLFLHHPSYNIFIKLMYVSVFVIWYLICKNYFLKKENYLRIISFYESKYKGRNNQMVIIGVLYSLITFSIFIALAIWLSRI